jgi:hypothetical protein
MVVKKILQCVAAALFLFLVWLCLSGTFARFDSAPPPDSLKRLASQVSHVEATVAELRNVMKDRRILVCAEYRERWWKKERTPYIVFVDGPSSGDARLVTHQRLRPYQHVVVVQESDGSLRIESNPFFCP